MASSLKNHFRLSPEEKLECQTVSGSSDEEIASIIEDFEIKGKSEPT